MIPSSFLFLIRLSEKQPFRKLAYMNILAQWSMEMSKKDEISWLLL